MPLRTAPRPHPRRSVELEVTGLWLVVGAGVLAAHLALLMRWWVA